MLETINQIGYMSPSLIAMISIAILTAIMAAGFALQDKVNREAGTCVLDQGPTGITREAVARVLADDAGIPVPVDVVVLPTGLAAEVGATGAKVPQGLDDEATRKWVLEEASKAEEAARRATIRQAAMRRISWVWYGAAGAVANVVVYTTITYGGQPLPAIAVVPIVVAVAASVGTVILVGAGIARWLREQAQAVRTVAGFERN